MAVTNMSDYLSQTKACIEKLDGSFDYTLPAELNRAMYHLLKDTTKALQSPIGSEYTISFDDTGALLINNMKYVAPTNNKDEAIAGNKIFTGLTSLDGGLQMTSSNGTRYKVVVDDAGALTTVKEV